MKKILLTTAAVAFFTASSALAFDLQYMSNAPMTVEEIDARIKVKEQEIAALKQEREVALGALEPAAGDANITHDHFLGH